VDRYACFYNASRHTFTERSWSWVRVVAVDEDGQVHFQQISGTEAAKSGRLATAS
jgi:hypothetical protein